ncbi:hypothetical protein [Aliiruegeria sabulilitoris]|uniref:hypothetical protein n=1 Tax=Aliiruegeria sabulilitoris TaxID=1510458 RepID=UPI00082C6315|nr:hypothetical protein [Aliiruegeria sabulilitoris]NDR55082.1 hypothetical protein [Pseudoruegeria sp. M32A2M]
MSIALHEIKEVPVDWRQVEIEVRSEQAKVARAMGSSLTSFFARVFKAPAALFGGRVETNLRA